MFYLESNGAGFLIRAKHNGKVLEVPRFSDGAEGTSLQFGTKNGEQNQRFSIINNNFGGVSISAYNGKFIGSKDGKIQSLAHVTLQTAKTRENTWLLNTI